MRSAAKIKNPGGLATDAGMDRWWLKCNTVHLERVPPHVTAATTAYLSAMAILAQTTVKHPVEGSNIPVYAVNGYDLPVERRPTVRPCFARPPSQPFQTIRPGHAQRSNKRRKTNRESKLDPAQLQEQQHHEQQVAPWLASCLRAVQELKPAWVDPERDGVELLDKSAEGEQEVNMVNWQRPSSSKQSPVHLLSSSTSVSCH